MRASKKVLSSTMAALILVEVSHSDVSAHKLNNMLNKDYEFDIKVNALKEIDMDDVDQGVMQFMSSLRNPFGNVVYSKKVE